MPDLYMDSASRCIQPSYILTPSRNHDMYISRGTPLRWEPEEWKPPKATVYWGFRSRFGGFRALECSGFRSRSRVWGFGASGVNVSVFRIAGVKV